MRRVRRLDKVLDRAAGVDLRVEVACHRVLRMRLKQADRAESPSRLLQALQRIQQQAADGRIVRGVTTLAPQQRELFAGIPNPKTKELAQVDAAVFSSGNI